MSLKLRHLMFGAGAAILASTAIIPQSAVADAPYSLKILHMNDHHSHLQPNTRMGLKLSGESTRVQAGGFPRLVTLFDQLSAGRDNVLKLHAGDAITGDLFYTLFKGEADAAMMNEVCFDAFAVGNHEFDDGDAGLRDFINFLRQGSCLTPVLGANVVPKVGESPLALGSTTDYLNPYVIKQVAGQQVGIIGIDIAKKTKQSSSPDDSTQFLDEAVTAQKYIDELEDRGVNKIILLTHYQYLNDLNLAMKLRGVDVIIGGDSHSLLGDFKDVGLSSDGPYPTILPGADGQTVCVAQAWEYALIVGELDVTFDHAGKVVGCQGTPHMPIADSFKRKNAEGKRVELTGGDRNAAYQAVSAHPNIAVVTPDADATARLEGFVSQVEALRQTKIGTASSTLCLERIPGQGRSKLCDVDATAQNGADISNVVAQAFRFMAKGTDIAIQNAGGVRVDLAEGEVTIGDAYTLLPFANTLMELDMTGAEIHAVLEDALDYALSEGGSTGAYPYAAGLRWDVTASNAKGQRIQNIQFKGRDGGAWAALNKSRTYKVVTNNYIAGGRDGYSTFKTVVDDGRALDTYLDYAQSFVDYVQSVGTLKKLPVSEYSTQSYRP